MAYSSRWVGPSADLVVDEGQQSYRQYVQTPTSFYEMASNLPLERFTPWQIIVSTLTAVYSIRNLDKLLGLNGEQSSSFLLLCLLTTPTAPEPLARLVRDHPYLHLSHAYFLPKYSPAYYRATWIVTGLDAGFATAMSIRPKWIRDIASIIFSFYYIIYAQEADEKVFGNPFDELALSLINCLPPLSFASFARFRRWKCSARHGKKPLTPTSVSLSRIYTHC